MYVFSQSSGAPLRWIVHLDRCAGGSSGSRPDSTISTERTAIVSRPAAVRTTRSPARLISAAAWRASYHIRENGSGVGYIVVERGHLDGSLASGGASCAPSDNPAIAIVKTATRAACRVLRRVVARLITVDYIIFGPGDRTQRPSRVGERGRDTREASLPTAL